MFFLFTRDPSEDYVNTNSPLISIWGDYTGKEAWPKVDFKLYHFQTWQHLLCVFSLDSQGTSLPLVLDSKAPWSDEETLHLLDIWGKDSVQRALKGCLKNRHIFTQIAQKMSERGYMRSVEQCQTRIKRLKKYYRQNKWVVRSSVRFLDPEQYRLNISPQLPLLSNTRKSSKLEYRFSEQLERILGSSASSAEITYDIEDINEEEEESQDGDNDDLQFVGQTSRVEVGTVLWCMSYRMFLIQKH